MTTIEIICTVIGAVATVLGGMYYLFVFVLQLGKDREHRINFENATKEGLDQINKRLDKVCDTVLEHTTALVEIYAILGRKYPKRRKLFMQKHSPYRLTELGKKICDEVQGEKFLQDNKDVLFEYIDEHKPLTRLDVEELAAQALFRQTSKPIFNYIKDYVYEAPSYKDVDGEMSKLTIGDICFILSIPLRDMYLKERNFK